MSFSYRPLLITLIDKGMTKEHLRKAVKAGPNSFAKIAKSENISLDLLDRICTALHVPIEAVIEHVPEPPQGENEDELHAD